MKREIGLKLVLLVSPVFVLAGALWFLTQFRPVRVEVEGVGSQLAFRALAQACRLYSRSPEITVHRSRADSLTDLETLVYDRQRHTIWRCNNFAGTSDEWKLFRVRESDVLALSTVNIAPLDDNYANAANNFLRHRGCYGANDPATS